MKNNTTDYNSSEMNKRRVDPYYRKTIRISDVALTLKKNLMLIGICAIVGLILGIILSVVSYMRGEMSKQYSIRTTIAVTSQNEQGKFISQTNSPNNVDIHLAEDMVDAVSYVIKSDKMLHKVVDETELLGVSPRDIASNLTVTQYAETQIIDITLTWRSAAEGVEILKALNKVSSGVLNEALKIGRVTVINEPTSRYLIGGTLRIALWGYMMVVGIMVGVVVAILGLLIRPTLLNSTDPERDFNLEILGEIPESKAYFSVKRDLLKTNENDEIYTDVLDSFMSVAQIIKSRVRDLDHPCIYITSPSHNEGSTTITAFLGVFLADLGMKVLMVDLNTKNPKLGGLFLNNVEYENSLNALYRGDSTRDNSVIPLTSKLDILPAVLEKTPLAYDHALLEMVSGLKSHYDIVLLDTAPVGQVADTLSLNEIADFCLLNLRFDGASWDMIREAFDRLDKSGVCILGYVVNGARHLINLKKVYGNSGRMGKRRKKNEKSLRKQEWENWEKEHPVKPDSAESVENEDISD